MELKINIIITDFTIMSARKNRLIKEKSVLLAKPKLCVAISHPFNRFSLKYVINLTSKNSIGLVIFIFPYVFKELCN